MAQLELYIDFKSPAAYLALRPTVALLEDLQPTVRWSPFISSQHAVPAATADETRGAKHKRIREAARRATHLKYAAIQQTAMAFPDTPGSSDLALAALLHAQPRPLPYIEAAFRAYWVAQLDLNDPGVVAALLADNGYDEHFNAERSLEQLHDAQTLAEEAGIIDTPAFVVDGNVFIGREHLPWIRALLS